MIRLLDDSDKQSILDYHARNETETSFFQSNVMEFGVANRKDMRRCADYYGYFENDILKGVLPFYNLGSCIPHYESDEAVPYFAELMKEREFEFLLGMERVIMPLFREIEKSKTVLAVNDSSYYMNRAFKPFACKGLEFLDPHENISDMVVDFIMYARTAGFNEQPVRDAIAESLKHKYAGEDKVVAIYEGKPVAYAVIQTNTANTSQIGGVFTHEEQRGKGYCKALVSELCRRIASRGKIPTLFVRKNNTPAVRAYNALGFEHVDDYLLIKFKVD